MMSFILTPRAEQCQRHWDYIADDSIEAADRVLAALVAALNLCGCQRGRAPFRIPRNSRHATKAPARTPVTLMALATRR